MIDSGSTDGTVEYLRQRGVRVIEIPNAEFNHGATRNLGVAEARSEIVALVTQDACPADDRWLQQGDKVQFGDVSMNVHHCPGHTPGHVIFHHVESGESNN